MTVRGYRDLFAWQRSVDLAADVYQASRTWPQEELYGLTAQVRQAAISVVANIAEGQGRTGSREFLHHLSIADGSLSEVEALLIVANRLEFLDDGWLTDLLIPINDMRTPLRGLIRRLLDPSRTSDPRPPTSDSGDDHASSTRDTHRG